MEKHSLKELVFFEWVVVDNCNLHCPYCVNKGEYSHKAKADMVYVPGREVEIARRIVAISENVQKVVVNLTGGEPLLAQQIAEVIDILSARPNITIQLITNFTLIEKISAQISKIGLIIVSLHVQERTKDQLVRLISLINRFKTQVRLRISQVDHQLTAEDRDRLASVASQTGFQIDYQRYVPPWTDAGRPDNAQKISDANFVSSAGKRCALGYFYYFILPDGKFHYGLWCNPKTRRVGDFLAPIDENKDAFASTDMAKCGATSCGCNYNTFYYDEYYAACARLKYPRSEIFGRANLRERFPVWTTAVNIMRRVKHVMLKYRPE